MSIASMTGFARGEEGDGLLRWAWEARSVNGKSLDLRLRLPSGFESLDPPVRAAARERFLRGNLSVSLEVRAEGRGGGMQINEPLLATLIARCEAYGETPRLDALLAVRGVLEPMEEAATGLADEPDRAEAILATLRETLDRLTEVRAEEGARIGLTLHDHLGEIESLVEAAEQCGEATPAAIRDRLAAQLVELLPEDAALPSERLAQEAAALAVKADVREEIDRLKAHVEAARDLLREGAGIGRRFDFLCQEFNREANTLASKSGAIELTRIGLDLKAVIDRLREQVQNLE